ncbi:hypothetical protein GCM10023339_39940 [Alloalcanivorax gelatiniphagus]
MDEDLEEMDRDQLVAQIRALRAAVRTHRDSSGHDLCWHHPDLWGTLPEEVEPDVAVPPWPQFMRGCVAYRQSLDQQAPGAAAHAAEYDDGQTPTSG